MKKLIIILLFFSIKVFSQEYEIAWENFISCSYAQFSKDGEFIYVANDSTIRKIRSSDCSYISTFDGTGFVENDIPIYGIFYLSGKGNYLLACTDKFNIWDVKSEKGIKQIQKIKCMDISSDEKYLILADKFLIFKTLFSDTNKLISQKIYEDINKLKVSHNGKMFATASKRNSNYYLTLWDTETLAEIKRFDIEGNISTTFKDIKFSWDDKYVGCLTNNPNDANIFSTETYKLVLNSKKITPNGTGYLNFTGNNKYILLYYPEWDKKFYNLYFVDRNSTNLEYIINSRCYPLVTSSNDLIFTSFGLLRPRTVGVTEQKPEITLVSPNPSNDYITLNHAELDPASIEIFNLFGMKLSTTPKFSDVTPQEGNFKIDISNLAPGVYFIKIGDRFEKFVKW